MSKKEKPPASAQDQAVQLAEETLTGDLRDILLTHVRSMETPWSKMSEDAQQDKIWAIENAAEDIVRRAVAIISRRGFDTIAVKVADFTVKGGAIKGKFEAIVSEANVVALSDHQAKSGLIVLTDATDFFGERGEAKPDPDEPEIPLDPGDDGFQPVGENLPAMPDPA